MQAYETLISNISLSKKGNPVKTMLITSTQPEEGKTTITVNLALSMALSGKKVLLIDADLRKPRVRHIFNLNHSQGLADVLTGNRDIKDVIQKVDIASHESCLNVITSGHVPENAFNLMESPRLQESIDSLKNMYNMIIFDSPPVLSTNDSLVIAGMVDGVILVVHTGVVIEKDVKRAKESLDNVDGHILGMVMNRFDEKYHGAGIHPYHQYYTK